jgi:hypothetical protein
MTGDTDGDGVGRDIRRWRLVGDRGWLTEGRKEVRKGGRTMKEGRKDVARMEGRKGV